MESAASANAVATTCADCNGELTIARLPWRIIYRKTPLDLEQLRTAIQKLGIAFADPDLTKIIGTQPAPAKPTFGREIRNRLIHDFGPSNVDHAKAAPKY